MSIPPKVTQRSINGLSGFRNGAAPGKAQGKPDPKVAGTIKKVAVDNAAKEQIAKPVKTDLTQGDVQLRTDMDLEKVLAGESLPVLDAFRKFIDKERLRVRRTVLGLAGVFVVMMMLVLAVSGLVGKAFFSGLRRDMEADHVALKETQADFTEMKNDVFAATKTLQDAMVGGEADRAKVRERIAELNSSVEETRRHMAGLGTRITGMEKLDNSGMEDLQISFRTLTNQVETLFLENSALRTEIRALNARYQGASVAEQGVPEGIFLEMVPSNTKHQVTWRLPDPS